MKVRTRAELIAALATEPPADYLFFWGHTPSGDGEVGKWCLSQWYPAAFTVQGVEYRTAEHYMMAEKARLFQDREAHAAIVVCAIQRLRTTHTRQETAARV